jgi:hypothetical protein
MGLKLLLQQGADIEARSGKLHNNTPAGWAIDGALSVSEPCDEE